MTQIMKVRFHEFGGNDVLRVERLEQSGPDARQILIRVRAASVNPVDFKIRSGKYPSVKGDRLPYTLGRDVSGIVETCGAQATRFQPGDAVFGMVPVFGGGYAERAVLDERAVADMPVGLDHVQAAAIPLAGQTAYQGLFRRGKLKAGETILIHGGSGGVGHFAIQLAKAVGARVLTTVSTEHVDFARSLGADMVIDYKSQRFEEVAKDLDMVFDLIDGETRGRSWDLLKKGGRLISTLTEPSQDSAKALGVTAMRYTVEPDGEELAEIGRLADAGKLKPHIQATFPLEQAAEALASVERGHTAGKVVLTCA
ncbi:MULTISPECIES: NADP-dependent oxidoreductase [Bradyrhizobium]|uniref:NADP-dependent oxidoreductase n=1 Tax=Bradyrhizobium elkanii TaxID=29448 RepID=A0A4U6S646_BRAEL|nr:MULTISPECIES: NADP-dependent oxidoreductase [Bradyrhizobium]MTV18980.1 NADP-dependent oxidoreductase [Bradyrhizobium sp. BR2003]TKV83347.1 NADP-dependent oxidoreductase [Bradyrhizobium elkanii]